MKYLFLLLIFFHLSGLLFAQNIFDYQNSKLFADYLFNTKQYNLAAIEYERLLFLDTANNTNKAQLLRIYRIDNQIEKGITRGNQLFADIYEMPDTVALEYSKLLLKQKNKNLELYLNNSKNLNPVDKNCLRIVNSVQNKDWKQASLIIQNNKETEKIQKFSGIVTEYETMKRKSPFLAASMSIIVPGLGKVYTGWWKDGLLAFLSVATFSWQAYNGFHRDGIKSPYGWTFGSIGSIFYLSTIYGSAKSANQYNKRNETQLINKARGIIDTDF